MNQSAPPKHVAPPWWWLGLANRPGSRRLRRRLVIGTWIVWLALAAYVRLEAANLGGWSLITVPTLIMMLLWLGSRRYVDTPSLAGGELDERLKQVGTNAMARAYQILVLAVVIAWPLSLAAEYWQPDDAGRTDSWLIWAAVFLLGTTLPTMIVAWREPDPVGPEQLPA